MRSGANGYFFVRSILTLIRCFADPMRNMEAMDEQCATFGGIPWYGGIISRKSYGNLSELWQH